MATPQELYAKKLDEIAARFDDLNEDTIRRTVGMLQDMRQRLHAELGQGGTEFNEFRLRQMIERSGVLIADFEQQLQTLLQANLSQAFEVGGQSVTGPLGAANVQGVFFSPNPAQLNAVLDFSADLVKNIGDDLRKNINTQLRLAAMGERTPFAAMRGITQALGIKARDGVWGTHRRPEVVKGVMARAEAILRTELTRVYNLAGFSQMQANNKVIPGGLKKRWIATLGSPRTRPAHLAAHAATADKPIPIEQAFEVGGYKLRFPGDPLGPASQTVNCRCRMVTVLPDETKKGSGARAARDELEKLKDQIDAEDRALSDALGDAFREKNEAQEHYIQERDKGSAQRDKARERVEAAWANLEELQAQRLRFINQRRARYRQALYVDNPVTITARFEGGFSGKVKDRLSAAVDEFEKLVSSDALTGKSVVIKTTSDGRSYYASGGGTVYISGAGRFNSMVHELGHWLEEMDEDIHRRALEFYDRRTEGEELTHLGQGYDASEMTRFDKFLDPYMGKEYRDPKTGERIASEIISMGIEAIATDAADFAKNDPDYFDFIYDVLRGQGV